MDDLFDLACELIITPLFENSIFKKAEEKGFTKNDILEARNEIDYNLRVRLKIAQRYIKRFDLIEKEKKEKEKQIEKELKLFKIDKKKLNKIKKLEKENQKRNFDNSFVEIQLREILL